MLEPPVQTTSALHRAPVDCRKIRFPSCDVSYSLQMSTLLGLRFTSVATSYSSFRIVWPNAPSRRKGK